MEVIKWPNDFLLTKDQPAPTTSPAPTKKPKKAKATEAAPAPAQEKDSDTPMTDGDAILTSTTSAKAPSNPPSKVLEDFSSIYLRKVTAELADDLDKVREAKDFKSSSIPMLIHALKQGGSMYSAEEKRRVVTAASS
jgi:ribosome assembly protein 3